MSSDMQDLISLVEQVVGSAKETNPNSSPLFTLASLAMSQTHQSTSSQPNPPQNQLSNQTSIEGEPDTTLQENGESICFPETQREEFTAEVNNQLSKSFHFENSSLTNQSFVHSTKTFLMILLLNSLFASGYYRDVYSFVSVIINTCLLVFFTTNQDLFANSSFLIIPSFQEYAGKSFSKCWTKVKSVYNSVYTKLLNRFISKKNQLILGFVYKMTKEKIKSRLVQMKHDLFNPHVLFSCNSFTTYKLNYYLNGERYTIPIVNPHFESYSNGNSILMVLDDDGNDITSTVQPFLGPQSNFHGMKITPNEIGIKGSVSVLTNDGVEHVIKGTDHFPN